MLRLPSRQSGPAVPALGYTMRVLAVFGLLAFGVASLITPAQDGWLLGIALLGTAVAALTRFPAASPRGTAPRHPSETVQGGARNPHSHAVPAEPASAGSHQAATAPQHSMGPLGATHDELARLTKSGVLGWVSHEFRTPVNAISAITEILDTTDLTDHQRELVRTMHRAAQSLTTLANDILDLSQIEAGKLGLDEHPLDLRASVEEALDLAVAKAAEKNLELAYFIDERVPDWIVADGSRLRQVLGNLLGNALKFTDVGEVTIAVTSRRRSDGRHEIQFAVKDSGIGIPRERWDAIFQPFTQGDGATARRYGGTGLGLSICRRLCELMRGRIWVTSEVGVGSTFYFTITAPAHDTKSSLPRGDQPQLRGKRLLVVGDNAMVRESIRHEVERWGMTVRCAGTPADVVESIRTSGHWDAVILDRNLPYGGSISLVADIRGLPNGVALPIVMLTSPFSPRTSGSASRADAASPGFAAYLAKPVKPAKLYEALRRALQWQPPDSAQRDAASAKTGAVRQIASAADAGSTPRPRLRIIVADDDEPSRSATVAALGCLGHTILPASHGGELLELLRKTDADLILTDINMPVVDGIAATSRIRAQRPLERRPYIIGLTGESSREFLEVYLAAGMDDVLTKPCRLATLRDAVERAARTLAQDAEPFQEVASVA